MSHRAVAVIGTIALLCVLLVKIAHARNIDGQYDNVDPAIRQWYETRELTPEARSRFGYKSCCSHADVVKTQFRVDRSTGADVWEWLNHDKWEPIASDIIHHDEPTPTGEAVLFAVGGVPVCFFTPDGGI